jgi:hypothetical protein
MIVISMIIISMIVISMTLPVMSGYITKVDAYKCFLNPTRPDSDE